MHINNFELQSFNYINMQFENSRDYQQKLGTIYYALASLPLLAFTWIYLEVKHRDLFPLLDGVMAQISSIVLGVLMLASIMLAFYVFNKGVKPIRSVGSLREKLEKIYPLYIKFYLLLFLGLCIGASGYYLTQLWFFGFGFMMIVLIYSYHRPAPYKFCKDLRLPAAEKDAVMKFYTIR